MREITNLKFAALIDLVKKGDLSCSELMQETWQQIAEYDSALECYISLFDKNELLKQAEASDKRWKNHTQKSVLDGIPVAVKDNIHVRGLRTTCGSRILQNYLPPFDAAVTELLKAGGAIIIGKTNLDEFAMGSTTETSAYLQTKNPWNIRKVAGGSSGGSAAAVSGGMAVLALGSDTGGSIRQPASFCGICGLKPTYGLVSRYGLAAYASSLDQIGPMARDIAGVAALLNVIGGFDKRDSTSLDASLGSGKRDYGALCGRDIKALKIAVFPDLYKEGISGKIKNEFYKALALIKAEGAVIEEVTFPALHYIIPTYYFIATAEASSNLSRYDGVKYGYRGQNQENYEQMLCSTRCSGFGKEVKKRILLGNFVLSSGYYDEYYRKAQKIRKYIMDELKNIFTQYAAIAMPTTPDIAYDLDESVNDPLKMYLADITTVIANLAGVPALTLPVGIVDDMPAGLQLIGRPLQEDLLLQIGSVIEAKIQEEFIPHLDRIKGETPAVSQKHRGHEAAAATAIYSKEKIREISASYQNRVNSTARVLCGELGSHTGSRVTVSGSIHRINSLGGIDFFVLRDRTGMTQLVLEADIDTSRITCETVVEVTGRVTLEERSAFANLEIKVEQLRVYAYADSNLPVSINTPGKNLNLPTILDNRPLSLRNPRTLKIFKVQSEIIRCFSEFLRRNGFTEIKSPKLISGGTEGGTNIFEVKYFEKAAFLAQSPQFYKQIMVGSGLERVFEVAPVFRAEMHNTVRHLNEYTSMDFEMSFIDDEQDVIDMQEELIRHIFYSIKEEQAALLNDFDAEFKLPARIPRIHFLEALEIAEQAGIGDMDGDISPEGERAVCDYCDKHHQSSFVYVIGYPAKKRPMYTMPDERLPGYSRSFDLLFRGLEITTGGQRIHDYALLKKNMLAKGFNPRDFGDYLQCFQFGMPPHGGLGMGLERVTMKLLGLQNIREATLFPRDRNRLTP